MKHRYHDRAYRDWCRGGRLPWSVSALIMIILSLLLWAGIAALVHAVIG